MMDKAMAYAKKVIANDSPGGDPVNIAHDFSQGYLAAKMTHEDIARVAHEINRAYCEALGDKSHSEWSVSANWVKDSALRGVWFHLDNPDAGPEASHVSWCKQKVKDGWTYGPVKNPEGKEHPCLVSFSDLPKEQQAKDYLFRQVVHSLKRFLV